MTVQGTPGIGHNSLQVPHDGKHRFQKSRSDIINDRELCWKRFHITLLRMERSRLIKSGIIVPAKRSKTDG